MSQANERLDSIHALLEKGYEDSAQVLVRSLFELVVNLAYIDNDTETRLPHYLGVGCIPLTVEERQRLKQRLEQVQTKDPWDVVPKQQWKRLRDMCRDLGPDWLKEYETFYRYVSIPTHAGSFTLGKSIMRLLDQRPTSAPEKATVLITALDFHLRVAGIAASVFPKQMNLEAITEVRTECQRLGQSLARR